jgi:endonuclease/exonuclease/phosphatase family metal-dependent hydrolase
MAFNLAKCGFHRGGLSFREAAEVRGTLDEVAALIRRESVDIAFLSEVVWEAGPCPMNQVRYLAEASGLPHYAFGENYSFGLPWYRIRSGNAVISKVPLEAVALQQLAGPRGLFDPTNTRRALWVEVVLGARRVLAASIRNDSFDLENNVAQVAEILEHAAGRDVLLAGDFNAEPESASIRRLLESRKFGAVPTGSPTYPARSPVRQIDYVFAPAAWTTISLSVPEVGISDHRPVIATFALP